MSQSVSVKTAGVRCSDADRERTSERLREAAGEGRLRMDELEERLVDVYAARYQAELDALVADLPRPPGRSAAGWLGILATVWAQLGTEAALLLGRGGPGWTRRRLVLATTVLLFLVGSIISAVHGFGGEGGEHHGFERAGAEGLSDGS